MSRALDFLILSSFLLEVMILLYIEHKIWRTLYTPLVFLMVPYAVVLIVTIFVAGSSLGFVEFYYPSIILWNMGLLIFAVPSFVIGVLICKKKYRCNAPIVELKMPKMMICMAFFFSVLFIWHLYGTLGSSAQALGSDEFGEEFSGYGLWGHLRMVTLPLLMMSIYYVSRKNIWLFFPIIVFIVVSVLNQVKGWTIIPCLAALSIRLYMGKTKLSTRFILYIVLGGFLTFFTFYAMSILVVQEREVSDDFMQFIFGHFFHYLTSGTLGWSMDVERGLPDDGGSFEILIAQFVNLFKAIIGDKELVSPVNGLYYNTGLTLTNVRTFFGTIYINTNIVLFVFYVCCISTLMYGLKLLTIRYNNIYVYTIYFFYCSLLFMGWFDLYFSNLTIVEVPLILLMLLVVDKLFHKRRII